MSMVGILEDIRNAGFPGLFLCFFALIGLLLAALSMAFALARQRAAFGVGLGALVLAALLTFGGVLGAQYGRSLTDGAVSAESISKVQAERIRRIGYQESRSAAKLGVIFAVLPLLAGAFAALSGAKQKQVASPSSGAPQAMPTPDGGSLVAPIALLSLDVMGMASAMLMWLLPLPGRPWDDHDPRWGLLASADDVATAPPEEEAQNHYGPSLSDACRRLEEALDPPGAASAAEPLEDEDASVLSKAASRCLELQISSISKRHEEDPEEIREELQKLDKSPLVMGDSDRERLKEALAKVPARAKEAEPAGLGISSGTEGSALEAGAASATGRLPAEVIRRIMRRNVHRIRRCYEMALQRSPEIEGKVVVVFVIARDGAVTKPVKVESSTIKDKEMLGCVEHEVERIAFPQPEGGIVRVRYPFLFNAQ